MKSTRFAKPTKEQFDDYLFIQYSGITNMFDIDAVCKASEAHLTKNVCMYIMRHYAELLEEYGVSVTDESELENIHYIGVYK